MKLLAERGDHFGLLGDLLLPPHAGHGAGDGDEVGRGREQHAAFERPIPQLRILFERGGEEMLARNVHDDIVGGLAELRPIVLGAERLRMVAHGGDVGAEAGLLLLVVDLVAGVEEGVQRAFGVDHQLAVAGQVDDHVGAQAAVGGFEADLHLEVDAFGQAGLDQHVAERLFAPAAARLGA
jgi:hypothetical protein